jgi:uncharacterized protein YecE (DUF72 family)
MKVKTGCCGFPVSKKQYMHCLKVVEVQQTFYQPPRVETAWRWREEAPISFEFTLKAWQLITHEAGSPTYRKLKEPLSNEERLQAGAFKPTALVRRAWEATLEIAHALSAPLIVLQCPARFDPSPEHVANLRRFFGESERRNLILAWEPRGDWPRELVEGLCQELDLVPVVDPFTTPPFPGPLAYFRLHGRGGYRYQYGPDDFKALASFLRGFDEAYVMFNNLSMWADAQAFSVYLGMS